MKRILFALFAVLISSMTLLSCSNNDDDDNLTDPIVGTWKLVEVKESPSESYLPWPFETTYATFKSNGTYYGVGFFGTGEGSWTKKGSNVETYVDGQLYTTYNILSVSASDAELKMTYGNKNLWIKCKKQ